MAIDLASGAGPVPRYGAAGYADWDFTLLQRLLTEPRVVFFHLSQIVRPLPLRFSILHDTGLSTSLLSPLQTAAALAAIAAWAAAGMDLLRTPGRRS